MSDLRSLLISECWKGTQADACASGSLHLRSTDIWMVTGLDPPSPLTYSCKYSLAASVANAWPGLQGALNVSGKGGWVWISGSFLLLSKTFFFFLKHPFQEVSESLDGSVWVVTLVLKCSLLKKACLFRDGLYEPWTECYTWVHFFYVCIICVCVCSSM